MFIRLLLLIGLVSTGLLLFIMTTYEPSSIGALGIFTVFFLGYVVILCLLTVLLLVLVRLLRRIRIKAKILNKTQQLSVKAVYYYSSVLALAPVIVISLGSVGEVSFYEVSLILLFEILGCLYVAKRVA